MSDRDSARTIQPADSTSNHSDAQTCTNPSTQQHATSVAQTCTNPCTQQHATSVVCTNPCTRQHATLVAPTADEEYVPLSAEEMLSLSFLDPKVPWSANDGTDDMSKDCTKSFKSREPEIKCAYAYAPCSQPPGASRGASQKRNWYIWERKKHGENGNKEGLTQNVI